MTLNQVIKRLKDNAESHAQVETFYFGSVDDLLAKQEVRYPAIVVEPQTGGRVSITESKTVYPVKIFVYDLGNMVEDARENEQEVWSDCEQILKDYMALLYNQTSYKDWRISDGTNLLLYKESEPEYLFGVSADVDISAIFTLNRCQVPNG